MKAREVVVGSPLKGVLIAAAVHRKLHDKTLKCVQAAHSLGADYFDKKGITDVPLARNIVFTEVVAMQKLTGIYDVFLSIDDDMEWSTGTILRVVQRCRQLQKPVSAVYVTKLGTICATRLTKNVCEARPYDPITDRWATGLGFCAVPMQQLVQLSEESAVVQGFADSVDLVTAFCWSAPFNGKWRSEDFCFTARLGGCVLEPVGVGHVKEMTLWPDEDDLRRLAAGEQMPALKDSPPQEKITMKVKL